MSAREEILARARAALGAEPLAPPIPRDYRTVGSLDQAQVAALFTERVSDYRATVHRCAPADLAATLAATLADARRVVVPPGLDAAWLAALPAEIAVVRDHGHLSASDLDAIDAVVTGAAVGIAETGTIVLDAAPDQGRRALTLVPDHHVCVVRTERLVQTVPEGLARLDPRRPLTLISGPSATSDIELDRVEGVHGPRRLDVIVPTP